MLIKLGNFKMNLNIFITSFSLTWNEDNEKFIILANLPLDYRTVFFGVRIRVRVKVRIRVRD